MIYLKVTGVSRYVKTRIFYGEENNIVVKEMNRICLAGNLRYNVRGPFTTMLTRNLLSVNVPCLRGFSSAAASFLRTGDTLKLSRIFTSEDVLEYSKVSHDSNPLHFDSESARNAGFEDRLVHGMLVAALFPKIISSHFVSLMLYVFTFGLFFGYSECYSTFYYLINGRRERKQIN